MNKYCKHTAALSGILKMPKFKIEDLRFNIIEQGQVVVVRKQKTKELLNQSLQFILPEDRFYPKLSFLRLESTSHKLIASQIASLEKYLKKDIHTRKAVCINHQCFSFLQILIRDSTMFCFVTFRSSNILHLETDLYVITQEILKLMKTFKTPKCHLDIKLNNVHFYLT